jgi:hypothetical protein
MRNMSASVEHPIEGSLPESFQNAEDAHSELGDGSSSLSDIEDKEAEQDDLDDLDDQDEDEEDDEENEDDSDANDSEAETERLENSPHNQRKAKDVVLSSQAESRVYERSPSKLQHQFDDDEEEEDDENDADNLSDDEGSIAESTKSIGLEDVEQDPTTATTSLEDSSGEGKGSNAISGSPSKKRKRSLLPERGLADASDTEEPARKRTGSIAAVGEDYAIDDTISVNGDAETSNHIGGDLSDEDSHDPHEDEDEDNQEHQLDEAAADDELDERVTHAKDSRSNTDRKKTWAKRGDSENAETEQDEAMEGSASNEAVHETGDGDEHEEAMDVDGDEAEIALKNEEERKSPP